MNAEDRFALSVEDLTVAFPRQHETIVALSHVTVSFAARSRVAIVGETGSGKSLLAAAILQLLPSGARLSGSIRLGEEELLGSSESRLREFRRKTAALVPQSPIESLNPMMPVRAQLTEGVEDPARQNDSGSWLSSTQPTRRVDDALSMLGYPPGNDAAHRYAYQLSGGLAQRAVVAGALAREPRWIVADEPTKGLDASLRIRAVHSIERLCDETESGLILITHDLDVAKYLADRVLVLYAGDILEDAAVDRFFESPAHPYARGLLESLPEHGLRPIPGDPPQAGSRSQGCSFAPRCSLVRPECTHRYPAIRAVGPAQSARCVLYPARAERGFDG